jgi:glycosyltransferase involved in cell wall biosynthesis
MSLNPDTLVTVITLLQNDSDLLDEFVEEITAALKIQFPYYEILLVDNCSTDDTEQRVRASQVSHPNIHYMRLSRRYDTETAYAAGLENSLGDYVVVMDLRHDPPSDVSRLLAAAEGHEVVIGERIGEPRPNLIYGIAESVFYKVANACLPFPLTPNASYFRCLSRQVVNSITRIRNKSRYLKYLNTIVGFRQTFVPYSRKPRRPGQTARHGLFESIGSGMSLIVANSAVPLRVASFLGLTASLFSLLYLLYVLIVTLVKRQVAEGWVTTNGVSTVMFFLLFLILTILAEYVARLVEEVQDRPLYFIEYETHSSVTFFKKNLTERLNVD